jgi:hypothetical protein
MFVGHATIGKQKNVGPPCLSYAPYMLVKKIACKVSNLNYNTISSTPLNVLTLFAPKHKNELATSFVRSSKLTSVTKITFIKFWALDPLQCI